MDERFNTLTAILGKRGSGKSLYLLGSKHSSNPKDKPLNKIGMLDVYEQKPMKQLIVDTIDHPSYRNIPILAAKDLPNWQSGIYRCFTKKEHIPNLLYFLNSQKSIWNTHLIFEDAYKHTFKTIDRSLIELMSDSKQKNIDITFMYHAFGQAPPDLFRNLDYIELFKTKDSPKSRSDFMPGYYEEALEVYEKVKADKDPFKHLTISTDL